MSLAGKVQQTAGGKEAKVRVIACVRHQNRKPVQQQVVFPVRAAQRVDEQTARRLARNRTQQKQRVQPHPPDIPLIVRVQTRVKIRQSRHHVLAARDAGVEQDAWNAVLVLDQQIEQISHRSVGQGVGVKNRNVVHGLLHSMTDGLCVRRRWLTKSLVKGQDAGAAPVRASQVWA